LDLVTAIKVSVEFGREAYNVVFGLTLCLILVPLFLVSVLSTVQTFQHPLAFETVARQLDFKDLGLYLLPVLSTIFPRFCTRVHAVETKLFKKLSRLCQL
jgi:hypothetical protein